MDPVFAPLFVVIGIVRRDDGRVDVTYSLASGVHYIATIVPGTDMATAIDIAGTQMASLYAERGYL